MKHYTKKWEKNLEAYLDNKMSDTDRMAFEEECLMNEDLLEELLFRQELQRLVHDEGIAFMSEYKRNQTFPDQVSEIIPKSKYFIPLAIAFAGSLVWMIYFLLR